MLNPKQKYKQGQIMLIFALALVVLMAFLGLAVDGGMLYTYRQNMQSAADAAAFAGGLAKIKSQDIMAAAQSRATSNGYQNGVNDTTVTVNSPPIGTYNNGDTDYVQVIITAKIPTFFIHIVFPGISKNTVQSVVYANPYGQPIMGNDVLVGANKTSCDSVLINGGVNVTVNNGGNIRSNSDASSHTCNSMQTNGTSGSIVTLNGGHTLVVGAEPYGFDNSGHLTVDPPPLLGTVQKDVPDMPAPACNVASNFGGTITNYGSIHNVNATLHPGVYSGISINNQTLTFLPGLYCINGDFSSKGNITGNDVLLVITGSFDLGGSNSVTFSANQSDPYDLVNVNGNTTNYKGMLIYSKSSSSYEMNGSGITNYTGTIYVPNADCTINGNNTSVNYDSQIICDTVTVSGNGNLTFTNNSGHYATAGSTLSLMH